MFGLAVVFLNIWEKITKTVLLQSFNVDKNQMKSSMFLRF